MFSIAGFILGIGVKIYSVIAVYQPVVNGVGGNLVAIFASRLSTSLHRTSTMGTPASWQPETFLSYPYQTFFGAQSKLGIEYSKWIVEVFHLILCKQNRSRSQYRQNFTRSHLAGAFNFLFCSLLLES